MLRCVLAATIHCGLRSSMAVSEPRRAACRPTSSQRSPWGSFRETLAERVRAVGEVPRQTPSAGSQRTELASLHSAPARPSDSPVRTPPRIAALSKHAPVHAAFPAGAQPWQARFLQGSSRRASGSDAGAVPQPSGSPDSDWHLPARAHSCSSSPAQSTGDDPGSVHPPASHTPCQLHGHESACAGSITCLSCRRRASSQVESGFLDKLCASGPGQRLPRRRGGGAGPVAERPGRGCQALVGPPGSFPLPRSLRTEASCRLSVRLMLRCRQLNEEPTSQARPSLGGGFPATKSSPPALPRRGEEVSPVCLTPRWKAGRAPKSLAHGGRQHSGSPCTASDDWDP